MFKFTILVLFFFFITNVNADVKNQIIKNLKNTENFDFNFEQNTNGKIKIFVGLCKS